MLLQIREKVTGWLAYTVVGLISIPFALWGISFYFQSDNDPVVFRLGDQTITLSQYDAELARTRGEIEGRGQQAPPYQQLRNAAIGNLLRDRLVDWGAARSHFRVPDQMLVGALMSEEEFQVDGRFDRQRYMRLIGYSSLRRESYENSLKDALLEQHFISSIVGSNFMLDGEQDYFEQVLLEERNIRYVELDAADYVSYVEVTEKEKRKYYDGHTDDFYTLHRVRFDYIELNVDDFIDQVEVNEEQLGEFYQDNMDYFLSSEGWRIAHILIDPNQHADAEQRAQTVYDRLSAGEDFAELANEYSDDVLTAENGGELPPLMREDITDEQVEEAIFSLGVGEFSAPVESRFGIQLFKLMADPLSEAPEFEEIINEVEKRYRREKAFELYDAAVVEIAKFLYYNKRDLVTVAARNSLEIKSSDWQTPDSEEGVLQFPKVKQAAFYQDLHLQDKHSGILAVSPEHMITIDVTDEEHPRLLEYEEVEDEIRQILEQEAASEWAYEKYAVPILNKVNQGLDLEQAITEASAPTALQIESVGFIKRDQEELGAKLVALAYEIKPPLNGKPSYKIDRSTGKSGNVVLMELSEVRQSAADEDELEYIDAALASRLDSHERNVLFYGLLEQAELEEVATDLIADER